MISDTERREVARRLRETGEELGSSVLLWYHIAKILGVRTSTDGKTACDMLADLIEPSGHECVPGECPLNVCHDNDRIDRDALLELAEDVTYSATMATAVDASKSAKLLADMLLDIARRIREACGEVA